MLRIAVDMAEQLHFARRLHRSSSLRAARSRTTLHSPVSPSASPLQYGSAATQSPEAELRGEVDRIRERLHTAMCMKKGDGKGAIHG